MLLLLKKVVLCVLSLGSVEMLVFIVKLLVVVLCGVGCVKVGSGLVRLRYVSVVFEMF